MSSNDETADSAQAMRERLRGDLRRSMKARDALQTGVLRCLIAALDNAGAIAPPSGASPGKPNYVASPYVATGMAWGSAEAARRTLGVAEVDDIIRREVEARHQAAGEMDQRGRPADADRARSEMTIAARYLSGMEKARQSGVGPDP